MKLNSEEKREIISFNIFNNAYDIEYYKPYMCIRANSFNLIYLNGLPFLLANKFMRFNKLGISLVGYNKYDIDPDNEWQNEDAFFFYDDNGNKIDTYYDQFGRKIPEKPIIKDLSAGNWQPSSTEIHAKSYNEERDPIWWRIELDGLYLVQQKAS